jgi:hypothetical protein
VKKKPKIPTAKQKLKSLIDWTNCQDEIIGKLIKERDMLMDSCGVWQRNCRKIQTELKKLKAGTPNFYEIFGIDAE